MRGPISEINQAIQIYEQDFESERLDPIEETFYFLRQEREVNPEKLIPSREEMKRIDEIVEKSFHINLKPH